MCFRAHLAGVSPAPTADDSAGRVDGEGDGLEGWSAAMTTGSGLVMRGEGRRKGEALSGVGSGKYSWTPLLITCR